MNTGSYPKTTSKAFRLDIANIAELLLLTSIGAIGVLLHARFRMPLHLPGHWGLVYMTLLLSGRMLSGKPYASSLSGLGAAFMLMFPLGFKDPFMPLVYLLPGIITDVAFYFFSKIKSFQFLMMLAGGLAYASIPLSRMLLSIITGFPYGSLAGGLFYPFVMHFLFGFAGSALGIGLIAAIRVLFKKRTS